MHVGDLLVGGKWEGNEWRRVEEVGLSWGGRRSDSMVYYYFKLLRLRNQGGGMGMGLGQE